MINQVTGIIGSLYYVGQADQINKTDQISKIEQVDKNLNEVQNERVGKIQRIERLSALYKHAKEEMPNECFKTRVINDEANNPSIVMVHYCQKYREIHLDGSSNKKDLRLTNPMKVKAAYFEDND